MIVVRCIQCNRQLVLENAIELPPPAKGLPPVYLCKPCDAGEQPETIDPTTLRNIEGVCFTIPVKMQKDEKILERIANAVALAEEDIKQLKLVSYEAGSTLLDQVGFEIAITNLWIDGNDICYAGKILNTKEGKTLVEQLDRGKKIDVRIRWGWQSESKKTPLDNIWVATNGDIEVEAEDREERVLIIDSVYVYHAPKKQAKPRKKTARKKHK